jgi:hypothetical protein
MTRLRHSLFYPLAFAGLFLSAGTTGCSIQSRQGSSDLPIELRSSLDRGLPAVGVPENPSAAADGNALGRATSAIADLPARAVDVITKRPARAATDILSPSANTRRLAILALVDRPYGRTEEAYRATWRSLASVDPDPVVRLTAVRAIHRSADPNATAILIAALSDGNERVRIEAVKALAKLPAAEAQAPLLKLLNDPASSVELRTWCADALRHYPVPAVQRALIDQLDQRDFAVAWQSRRSLFLQLKQDHRYDKAAWLRTIAG